MIFGLLDMTHCRLNDCYEENSLASWPVASIGGVCHIAGVGTLFGSPMAVFREGSCARTIGQ